MKMYLIIKSADANNTLNMRQLTLWVTALCRHVKKLAAALVIVAFDNVSETLLDHIL